MSEHHNLIIDVAGIRVGNAQAAEAASGVTAIVFDTANVASSVIRGGAPGGRDTKLLDTEMTVTGLDAVLLSGGSVFGLDAAGGAASFLREQGRGFRVGSLRVPIAVQAIIFDLLNGGDKNWGSHAALLGAGLAGNAGRIRAAVCLGYGGWGLRRNNGNAQRRSGFGQRGDG